MNSLRALDECCYHCQACGAATCRDETPTPAEEQRICEGCYETELPVAVGA